MGAAQTGCCSNRPGKENAYEDTDAPIRKQREPTEEGDPGAEHENEGSEDGQEETEGQATKTDGDTHKEGEGDHDEENLPVEQLLAESQKEVAQAEKALESQKTADGPKKEGEEGGAKFESTEGLPTKEKDDELSSPPTTPKKIDKLQVFTQVSPYQKDHVWYPIGSDGTTRLGVIRLCMFFDPTKEIMYVDVLNCENLVSPDKSGSADPYVKMRLRPGDTHKQKTTVVKKTLNPKFGQAFEFRVTRDQFDKESTAIEVGVWSSFSLKHNRLLGWILVDVNRLPQYNYDSLGKQRPASTLFTYALQPEHVYTLGACSLRKGDTIRYPDGSMRLPDGSFLDEGKATSKTLHSPHPGATLLHDGTIRQYDGSVILPSGAVLRPDGLLRLPSGLLRKPEWACHKVPLPRDVEQREDFKFYIEKQKVIEPERSNAALSVGVLRVSLKATKSSKKLHVFVAEARGLPIPKKSKMQTIIKVLLTPLPKRAPQEYEMVYTKPRPPTTPHLSSNTTPPPQLSPRGTLSTTTAAASPAEQTPRRRHSNAPSPPGSRDNSVLDSPTSVFAFPDKKRRNSAPLSVMEDAKGEAKKTKVPSKKHEGEPVWNEHFKFKLAELKEFKDKELDHYYLRLLIVRATADKQGEALGYIEIDLPKDNNEVAAWYAIQPPYPASGKPETELSGSNLLGRRASRSPSPTPPHTPRREDGEAPPSPTSPGTLPLTLPAHATAAAATPSPAAAPAASDPHQHQDSAAAASAATTSGTTTTTTSAELTSTSSSSTLSPGAASP